MWQSEDSLKIQKIIQKSQKCAKENLFKKVLKNKKTL
jgi:hypothetical protein